MKRVGVSEGAPIAFGDGRFRPAALVPAQYSFAAAVVIGVAVSSFLLVSVVGVHAVALIFLLAVVLLALFVDRGPTFLADRPYRLKRAPHPASTYPFPVRERQVALRAFDYGQPAGKFTGDWPEAGAFYLPLVSGGETVGVMGLNFRRSLPRPPTHQRNL